MLERYRSLGELVDEIDNQARVVKYRGKRGCEGSVKDCLRPEFKLELSAGGFDQFFNGRSGYRAAYYLDTTRGEEVNASVLQRISERLISYALSHPAGEELEEATLRRCLTLPSAKVWLDERDFSFDQQLTIEIMVPEWSQQATEAAACFAQDTELAPTEKKKAIWGVRAPLGTKIDVKGAFVATDGAECVADDKVHRSREIHDYGFA